MARKKAARKAARKASKRKKKIKGLFWKLMLLGIELHGIVCISISYWLAWNGSETCESLSSTIVSEIIAPVIAGMVSKTVENIFEHNELSFSKPIAQADTATTTQESEESVG